MLQIHVWVNCCAQQSTIILQASFEWLGKGEWPDGRLLADGYRAVWSGSRGDWAWYKQVECLWMLSMQCFEVVCAQFFIRSHVWTVFTLRYLRCMDSTVIGNGFKSAISAMLRAQALCTLDALGAMLHTGLPCAHTRNGKRVLLAVGVPFLAFDVSYVADHLYLRRMPSNLNTTLNLGHARKHVE